MSMRNLHTLVSELPGGSIAAFLAIHDSGSVSGAANRLHLSQPAVSRRLQMLERSLNTQLFERLATGMRLTESGSVFLPYAQRVVAAELDAFAVLEHRRNEEVGSVAIGVVGSLIDSVIVPLLRLLRQRHPAIDCELVTGNSSQIGSMVARGDVTLGVSYLSGGKGVETSDLDVRTIAKERLVVVCSADDPVAGQRLRTLDLPKFRWLVFPDASTYPDTAGTMARRILERHKVPVEFLRPIDSLTAQRALAIAGYGLALLPESMVADDLASRTLLIVKAPALQVETAVTLATRRAAPQSAAARTVIAALTKK